MRATSLAVALVLGATGPVFGQTKVAGQAAWQAIDAIATCTVERKRAEVEEALASPRDYKLDREVMSSLRGKDCLPGGVSVQIDSMMFRGALSRALVRADYRDEPARLSAISVSEQDTWASIMTFANCVVRADSAISYNLMMSRSGSDTEAAAFKRLSPYIERCKPWERVAWTKENLILMFSEAYYQASRPSSVSAK